MSLSKGSVIDSFVDATRLTFKIINFIFVLASLSKTFLVSATEIINSSSFQCFLNSGLRFPHYRIYINPGSTR
jgi:hypothetical protein